MVTILDMRKLWTGADKLYANSIRVLVDVQKQEDRGEATGASRH
jgi:hypothetical protein